MTDSTMKPRFRTPEIGYAAKNLTSYTLDGINIRRGYNAAYETVDTFEDGARAAANDGKTTHQEIFYVETVYADEIGNLVRDALKEAQYQGIEVNSRKVPGQENISQLRVAASWPFPTIQEEAEEEYEDEEDLA